MRNKIIILMVFIVPMAIFAFLQTINKDTQAIAQNQTVLFDKAKLIKFYSPMCSECKTVKKNIDSAIKNYDDKIIYEEFNVSEKNPKTQSMIETYKITVVPTVVFVDKQGKIAYKKEGIIEEFEIKNNLEMIK